MTGACIFSGCVRLASYRKSNQKLLMLSQGQSYIFAYQRSIRMGPTSTPKKRAAPGYPGRPDRNRTLREPSGSFNVRSFLSFELMLPSDARDRKGSPVRRLPRARARLAEVTTGSGQAPQDQLL